MSSVVGKTVEASCPTWQPFRFCPFGCFPPVASAYCWHAELWPTRVAPRSRLLGGPGRGSRLGRHAADRAVTTGRCADLSNVGLCLIALLRGDRLDPPGPPSHGRGQTVLAAARCRHDVVVDGAGGVELVRVRTGTGGAVPLARRPGVPRPAASRRGGVACASAGCPEPAGELRTVFDGLMVAASLLVCSWILVLEPRLRRRGDSAHQAVISLAYPVGDVVLITMVLTPGCVRAVPHGSCPYPCPWSGAACWRSPSPTPASRTRRRWGSTAPAASSTSAGSPASA